MDPAAALVAAHPGCFDAASAQIWVTARRAVLLSRAAPADGASAASSGCAVSGAHRHAQGLAADAARALARLDAGVGTRCEVCDDVLPLDRLDAAPAAVRCTRCAPASTADTRWCR